MQGGTRGRLKPRHERWMVHFLLSFLPSPSAHTTADTGVVLLLHFIFCFHFQALNASRSLNPFFCLRFCRNVFQGSLYRFAGISDQSQSCDTVTVTATAAAATSTSSTGSSGSNDGSNNNSDGSAAGNGSSDTSGSTSSGNGNTGNSNSGSSGSNSSTGNGSSNNSGNNNTGNNSSGNSSNSGSNSSASSTVGNAREAQQRHLLRRRAPANQVTANPTPEILETLQARRQLRLLRVPPLMITPVAERRPLALLHHLVQVPLVTALQIMVIHKHL
ncbi:uncharacterized protein EV420DRAFT_1152744 [Desarmillaria tabescens]|uniref:Uncharacterized protein n=1 Tax=Armillaria tabescens TaxID=1929756 RepID=A0AA39NCE1_ARMTA|nr:uncharacterized protein EV420DRAFT_1152744 [Desarmillaria tabescens]KAK0463060.1 hypothetical protein EV420DRAFT_1152744 [Desarmillaria tabescens]